MTADEFEARHKRLFVALAAYGWFPQFDDAATKEYATLETNSSPWRIYRLSIRPERRLAFALRGDDIVNRSYRHESSVLAALAKIHKGQTP